MNFVSERHLKKKKKIWKFKTSFDEKNMIIRRWYEIKKMWTEKIQNTRVCVCLYWFHTETDEPALC